MISRNDSINKWVSAIKSGKYKFGTGWLRSGNKFCVLGVACDVFKDLVGGRWKTHLNCQDVFVVNGKEYVSTLPPEIEFILGVGTEGENLPYRMAMELDQWYNSLSLAEASDAGADADHLVELMEENLITASDTLLVHRQSTTYRDTSRENVGMN